MPNAIFRVGAQRRRRVLCPVIDEKLLMTWRHLLDADEWDFSQSLTAFVARPRGIGPVLDLVVGQEQQVFEDVRVVAVLYDAAEAKRVRVVVAPKRKLVVQRATTQGTIRETVFPKSGPDADVVLDKTVHPEPKARRTRETRVVDPTDPHFGHVKPSHAKILTVFEPRAEIGTGHGADGVQQQLPRHGFSQHGTARWWDFAFETHTIQPP